MPPPDNAPLVLEGAGPDPDVPTRLVATVRLSGHRMPVVLDFAMSELIEYVDVPSPLAADPPAMRAVVSAMARIAAGEDVRLPLDLSDQVAEPIVPPMDPHERAELRAAADRVDLHVLRIDRSAAPVVEADMVLNGRPLSIKAELYLGAEGIPPALRWIDGPPPGTLHAAERYAIQIALAPPPR